MTELERLIVELRKSYSLDEVRRILRTTIGRVRSIEGKARAKLATPMDAK